MKNGKPVFFIFRYCSYSNEITRYTKTMLRDVIQCTFGNNETNTNYLFPYREVKKGKRKKHETTGTQKHTAKRLERTPPPASLYLAVGSATSILSP